MFFFLLLLIPSDLPFETYRFESLQIYLLKHTDLSPTFFCTSKTFWWLQGSGEQHWLCCKSMLTSTVQSTWLSGHCLTTMLMDCGTVGLTSPGVDWDSLLQVTFHPSLHVISGVHKHYPWTISYASSCQPFCHQGSLYPVKKSRDSHNRHAIPRVCATILSTVIVLYKHLLQIKQWMQF